MNKAIKILLIVASSLVGIGIICLCLSMAFGGVDTMFKSGFDSNIKTLTATFDEVEAIDVKDTSNSVRIVKSEKDYVTVKYTESDDYNYFIKNDDGKLTVEYNEIGKWYEKIVNFSVNFQNTDVVVEVPDGTALKELNVKSSSGSIEAKDVDSLVTTLKSTSGRVEVGGKVGDLTASATSGSVTVRENTEAEFMCLSTTSGSIRGEKLRVASIKAENKSGGIKLDNAICTGDMNLETTSGSINLSDADAKNYDLNSISGSIKAEILSPKLYNTKSTSGGEKTPELDPNADGILNAKSTSGSIKIELAD